MAHEVPKEEPKFIQAQYDILKRCSEAKDIGEWNRWRASNLKEKIYLEGANLNDAYLKDAGLAGAFLKNAALINACLEDAHLREADLTKAFLEKANLKGAKIWRAKLQSTRLHGANLNESILHEADCQGAWFNQAKLQGAQFNLARVDGLTSITGCEFDEETDFTGVALDAASIDPDLKMAFRNNIRRIHWQNWLKKNSRWKKIIVNPFAWFFWYVTAYGSSTIRLVLWFFGLAVGFGVLYHCMEFSDHSVVRFLTIEHEPWLQLLRSVYFSVVTMTTLGFGDMYAEKSSYLGHALLMCQVILGYVLLGALVTRLGILFTSEAPAAKPTPIKAKDKQSD